MKVRGRKGGKWDGVTKEQSHKHCRESGRDRYLGTDLVGQRQQLYGGIRLQALHDLQGHEKGLCEREAAHGRSKSVTSFSERREGGERGVLRDVRRGKREG